MTDTEQLSDWNRRLKARAEHLVQAVDALPAAVTAADIARQARVVGAVQRMINLLHGVKPPRAAKTAAETDVPDLPEDKAARIEALTVALEAELPPMNRQQRRMAERMMKKRG